ncbi:mitochondrial intermembrane space import and assembly protein 40 [Bactrocera oleae]|uniref:mitochondrial intermembrane space import and assembly protein 40 n=1 Tax=Bactrocera oleae TaxID=104688 RepID=UPI0006B705CC|nr:mitochondrial intermembrane space import and assembly protein 40 [Bactrocera oleae]XP_036224157.1 mitochondrial intermembrane space import and assembly protein 40 [Bactrocera oleae]
MSYCKVFGKDKVFFVTKEDHATPSNIELPPPEPPQGLITSDGEINWSCPCLGGMATGPCGVEFRDAFSCFHYSKADPKGSDCFEAFRAMQDCFVQYPTVYNKSTGNDEDDEEGGLNMPNLEEAEKDASNVVLGVEGSAVLTKKEN